MVKPKVILISEDILNPKNLERGDIVFNKKFLFRRGSYLV